MSSVPFFPLLNAVNVLNSVLTKGEMRRGCDVKKMRMKTRAALWSPCGALSQLPLGVFCLGDSSKFLLIVLQGQRAFLLTLRACLGEIPFCIVLLRIVYLLHIAFSEKNPNNQMISKCH